MPESSPPLIAGTLDLLILKTLSISPLHGYGIAQHIHRLSDEALRIEEGSLYPALRRMEVKGWVKSEVRKSPTGRDARYYRLTTAGTRQLAKEEKEFKQAVAIATRVLRGAES